MNENNIKPFGWRRNLDYVKVEYYLTLKRINEYKVNLYFALLEQFIFYSMYFVFFWILARNFGILIDYDFYDFLFYGVLIDIVLNVNGLFFWGKDLRIDIPKGVLNLYIIKPLKPKLCYEFSNLSASGVIMIIFNLFTLPILFYLKPEYINNIFIAFLLFILVIFSFVVFKSFIKSLNFFSFGLSYLFYNLDNSFYFILRDFPANFFKKSIFYNLFLFYPFYFISFMIIPVLKGSTINILDNLIFLFLISFIFWFFSRMLWHYGLKKYEAFG